jgi:PAS domain-containing protein
MNRIALPIAMAETLMVNSLAGILVYEGHSGNCIFANQSVADMLVGSVGALRLLNFRALACWRRAGLEDLAEAVLFDGLSKHHEATLHTDFGKTVSLDCFISRFDFEGRPHLLFIVTDITERERAQGKLARERALLSCLIDSVSDLIFSKATFVDANDRVAGTVGTLMDITERKQAERERLANLRFFENMDRVNRAIQGADDLEAMMRDLLDVVLAVFDCDRAILLYPCDPEAPTWNVPMERNKPEYPGVRDLGLAMPMDPQVAETLRILLAADGPVAFGPGTAHPLPDSAQKMGVLIDDLLAFSRMGRQAMSLKQVDLGTLVRDVIRELEPEADGRYIAWRIGDLPAVKGDVSMLRIVLGNLISNAVKFTRSNEQARIEVGCQSREQESIIFVRDNGAGFDPALADKLFGVFQRLHHKDEFEGTGVGLAIVQRIIIRHGGRTWAEGQVGRGATFYFSLPLFDKGDR